MRFKYLIVLFIATSILAHAEESELSVMLERVEGLSFRNGDRMLVDGARWDVHTKDGITTYESRAIGYAGSQQLPMHIVQETRESGQLVRIRGISNSAIARPSRSWVADLNPVKKILAVSECENNGSGPHCVTATSKICENLKTFNEKVGGGADKKHQIKIAQCKNVFDQLAKLVGNTDQEISKRQIDLATGGNSLENAERPLASGSGFMMSNELQAYSNLEKLCGAIAFAPLSADNGNHRGAATQ